MTSGNNPASVWLKRIAVLLLAACLLAGPACAAPATPESAAWNLAQLMHDLAQVNESKATFTEQKHLSLLKTPLESSGTLSYVAPAYLEKITLKPKPESMVLDRDKLTIRSGAAQRQRTLSLQEYPAIWAFVESIRATLAGDQAALERHYEVSLEGTPARWMLLLRPRDPKMKDLVSEIRIGGSGAQLESIETREAQGDYSVMRISRDDT